MTLAIQDRVVAFIWDCVNLVIVTFVFYDSDLYFLLSCRTVTLAIQDQVVAFIWDYVNPVIVTDIPVNVTQSQEYAE